MPKNKITTQGYFVRRLRDSGYVTSRVYDRYNETDARKWTVVIDPTGDSVMVTCWDNGEWPYRGLYEFADGGDKVPKGYHINTDSIDVILSHLNQFNISLSELNTFNGKSKQQRSREETSKEAG
jgi:hypothetical protein